MPNRINFYRSAELAAVQSVALRFPAATPGQRALAAIAVTLAKSETIRRRLLACSNRLCLPQTSKPPNTDGWKLHLQDFLRTPFGLPAPDQGARRFVGDYPGNSYWDMKSEEEICDIHGVGGHRDAMGSRFSLRSCQRSNIAIT